VSCADGRPALEGRRLAEQLAPVGLTVTHYADAALGQALAGADAVLVGADAVSPDWFLNKSGTRMLAAAAAHQGVPVYVCATRDKFASSAVAGALAVREESPDEIWPSAASGVNVRNPVFRTHPSGSVSALISDIGVLGSALVSDACQPPATSAPCALSRRTKGDRPPRSILDTITGAQVPFLAIGESHELAEEVRALFDDLAASLQARTARLLRRMPSGARRLRNRCRPRSWSSICAVSP
jgi:hypothetical protein